jgi:cyclic pyranopterin phosphate synthase
MRSIEMAERMEIAVKVNCVLIRGVNDDELLDFAEFTKDRNVHVRFIEYMPFDGNRWDHKKVVPYFEMKERIEAKYGKLVRYEGQVPGDTSKVCLY